VHLYGKDLHPIGLDQYFFIYTRSSHPRVNPHTGEVHKQQEYPLSLLINLNGEASKV